MLNKKLIDFYFVLITTLYSLAFCLMIPNRGIFWDDWILHGEDKSITIDRFYQAGGVLTGYLHSYLLGFSDSVLIYRIIIFLSFLLAGILLYKVLKDIVEIDEISRIVITLLFLLLPINRSRISIICAFYSLRYFAFFLGFYLVNKYINTKKMIYRIIALPILFFSFFTNSQLVFYIILLIYIFYREFRTLKCFRDIIYFIMRYLDIVLLPIIFWVIKSIFWVPYGIYEDYNSVKLNKLFSSTSLFLDAFQNSFVDVVKSNFLYISWEIIPFIVVIFLILLKICSSEDKQSNLYNIKSNLILLILGFVFFILAVYPYLVVGLMPSLNSWNDRHQLLVPLGAAFIIYFGSTMIFNLVRFNLKIRILFFSVFIGLFINTNIHYYLDFLRDSYKQRAIIEEIRHSEVMQSNTTFLFRDNCQHLNAMNREYSYYEFLGFMKESFGDETRFGDHEDRYKWLDSKNHQGIMEYKECFTPYHLAADYKPVPPEYIVEINEGIYKIQSLKSLIHLAYYEWFKPAQLPNLLEDIISFRYFDLQAKVEYKEIFRNNFNSWNGPTSKELSQIQTEGNTLSVQAQIGKFLVTRLENDGSIVWRLTPYNGSLNSTVVQLGSKLYPNVLHNEIKEDKWAQYIIVGRCSDKNAAKVFIQDKSDQWNRDEVEIDGQAWKEYVVSRKIRSGITEASCGINWNPVSPDSWLEIKDIRIMVQKN